MHIRILLSLALAVLVSGIAPAAFAQQLLYIHADHLNTPRMVTNASGTPVWRWDQTEPFGDNLSNEDPDGNSILGHLPLRFPGQYFDKETGLAYNMARDYASDTGRYIQSDPIGLAGGLNTYAYVGGNPISRIDPLGLDYISMYPQMNTMLNPPKQQSCGCQAESSSSQSQAAGQALGGVMAAGAGLGGATGLGLGIAATGTEIGSSVGLAGVAGAAAVGGKAMVTGLVLGGAAGACVGLVVAGVIYFSPPSCTPCTP